MDYFEKLVAVIMVAGIACGMLLMRWLFTSVLSPAAFFTLYAAIVLMVVLLCRAVYILRYREEIAQGKRLTNGWSITTFGNVTCYGEKSDDGKHFRWLELTPQKKHEFIGIGLLLVPGRRRSIFSMAPAG